MDKLQIETYINSIIVGVNSETAIERELALLDKGENYHILALGKAAWDMAKVTSDYLGNSIKSGLIITKYQHSMGEICGFEIIESAHPVPDENSMVAGRRAIEFVSAIPNNDRLIFLLSGGGSSLMEYPMDDITLQDVQDITEKLLYRGADIIEINTVRKHLSKVKGGRLAKFFTGGYIHSIIISDVLSDKVDSIASGPMCADESTSEDALSIIKKYNIDISDLIKEAVLNDTPKYIENVENKIILNINKLCEVAKTEIEKFGYRAEILTTELTCEAKEAGRFIASIAKSVKSGHSTLKPPLALIFGGETVVTLNGDGLGGRNQELALSAALEIDGVEDITVIAFGSDGTDGPTDAAGGFVDGSTISKIRKAGMDPISEMSNNNSYYCLLEAGNLLVTGPTGTNLNDVYIAIIK